MKHLTALATLTLVGLVGMPAIGQSRSDRIDQLTATLSSAIADDDNQVYTDATTGEVIRATPRQLMRETLTAVDFDEMPGRLALEIWSQQTGVPLVVNWAALERAGVDQQAPITLKLNRVPSEQVLKLIISQLQPDPIGEDALIIDIEKWYVRIQTKRQALRQSTTKIYFIGDLLMTVPNFTNAPGFDLNDALSNTNSGGSNGGGQGGGEGSPLFGENDDNAREKVPTKEEKAERIADMIRDMIEPEIWQANGGEYASVRYLRGMLVVKAPDFVHEQIGVPFGNKTTSSKTRRDSTYRSSDSSKSSSQPQQKRSTSGNVAGTAPKAPKLVR